MRTFLYIIWFSIPALFIFLALWTKLESWSAKTNRKEPLIYIKQGSFVFICALVALVIDQYFLEDLVSSFLDPFVPLALAQIVLFPIVLVLAALITGGTKPVQIQSKRVNRLTKGKKR